MPFQWRIAINKNAEGASPGVVFKPNPLQAKAGDQIFWANNDDSQPHWPGLLRADGTIDATFFMPNQIAPNGDVSQTFSPTNSNQDFEYACSLHPGEQGTITVT